MIVPAPAKLTLVLLLASEALLWCLAASSVERTNGAKLYQYCKYSSRGWDWLCETEQVLGDHFLSDWPVPQIVATVQAFKQGKVSTEPFSLKPICREKLNEFFPHVIIGRYDATVLAGL